MGGAAVAAAIARRTKQLGPLSPRERLLEALPRLGARMIYALAHFDEDEDGLVTKAQWSKAVTWMGVGARKDDLARIFTELDTNNEGCLLISSLPARLRALAKFQPAGAPGPQVPEQRVVVSEAVARLRVLFLSNIHRAVRLFTSWDEAGTGTISAADLRRALPALQIPASREDADALFDSFDVDGSGSLEYASLSRVLGTRSRLEVKRSRKKGASKKSKFVTTMINTLGRAYFPAQPDGYPPADTAGEWDAGVGHSIEQRELNPRTISPSLRSSSPAKGHAPLSPVEADPSRQHIASQRTKMPPPNRLDDPPAWRSQQSPRGRPSAGKRSPRNRSRSPDSSRVYRVPSSLKTTKLPQLSPRDRTPRGADSADGPVPDEILRSKRVSQMPRASRPRKVPVVRGTAVGDGGQEEQMARALARIDQLEGKIARMTTAAGGDDGDRAAAALMAQAVSAVGDMR